MLQGSLLVVLSAAGAGGAVWLVYLRFKDRRRPEPLTLLILTAILGMAAVGGAFLGYEMLDGLGLAPSWLALAGPWSAAIPAAIAIGLVEEAAKLLPVLPIAWVSRHFDELWDGFVYAGAAGVGFALAESVSLFVLGETGLGESLVRAATTPITHALFAAPWGLGLAVAILQRRWWGLPLGLAVAAGLHGTYDLLLAQPGLQTAAAGLVGLLWLFVIAAGTRSWLHRRIGR